MGGSDSAAILAAIERDLRKNPFCGKLVPGLRGVRKARTANPQRGKGKRGGLRYFYFVFLHEGRLYLLWLLDKNEAEDLTQEGRAVVLRAIQAIRESRR